MEWDGQETVFVGLDKIDLQAPEGQAAEAGSVTYGPGIVAGEAFFVPSHADPAACNGGFSSDIHV